MSTNKEREWIDTDKLREIVESWDQRFITSDADRLLRDLRALLPVPQPRTLADTEWDDKVHPYMEAVTVSGRRHILLAPMGDTAVSGNTILVAEHDGGMPVLVPAEYLFPTGRYARLSLPDEHPNAEEDVSIIPPKIDTSAGHDDHVDMTPQDAPDGYYLVRWWGEEHPVPAEKVQGQWWVIGKPTMLPAKEITIVSRLVPEVEA